MAKFKQGDKVVRRASRQADQCWLAYPDPAGPRVVKSCDWTSIQFEGCSEYWEPGYFELYTEPQPEPVTVTEPVQRIPGVPDGYRLVRIGEPQDGERYVDGLGGVSISNGPNGFAGWAVVEPIVPPAPPTPIPSKVKVQLNRYLVGDLTRPSSLRVVECTQENIDSCYFGYRLLGPSETLELEVEV